MLIILVNILNLLGNFVIGLIVAAFLGPAEFGRFAIAIGIGGLIQIAAFGWLKLAAARFCTPSASASRPDLRRTLDRTLALLVAAMLGLGLLGALAGDHTGISPSLAFWALAFSAANGAFEYFLALLRARFHDRAYAGLMIVKIVFALGLTAGLAFATNSPAWTMAGTTASLTLATLVLHRALHDPEARGAALRFDILRSCLAYAVPVSASLVLFALIPIANRTIGAQWIGLAEAGQLALAQDIGLRLALAIGVAMDALLFQLAVRADEHDGSDEGRAQIARNMGLVAAVILPALAGVWIVMPSFEALIVPHEFRGPFARALVLLLPGLACYALMTFALAPAFQIVHRTWPVIAAAALACCVDLALLLILPRGWGLDAMALAQTGALAAGLLMLVLLSPLARPHWPRRRDIFAIPAAIAAMIVVTLPLRALDPGAATLALQAALGAIVYGALVFAFDIAGLRRIALEFMRAQKKRAALRRP